MTHPDHGPEAFTYARTVLKWCKEQGLKASVTMFDDGSGKLVLYETMIQSSLARTLEKMLHSERWGGDHQTMTLTSCCGWHE